MRAVDLPDLAQARFIRRYLIEQYGVEPEITDRHVKSVQKT